MSLKDNLEHKVGPLPAIAWAGMAGGLFLGYAYYRHAKAAKSSTTGPVTLLPNQQSSSDLSGATDFTSGFTNSTPPSADSLTSDPSVFTEPTIQSNVDWGKSAVNFLIANGYNPVDAATAIAAYLFTGQPLNSGQTAMLNIALAHFGSPPEGVLAPPVTTAAPTIPTTPTIVAPSPTAPPAANPPADEAVGSSSAPDVHLQVFKGNTWSSLSSDLAKHSPAMIISANDLRGVSGEDKASIPVVGQTINIAGNRFALQSNGSYKFTG